MACYSMFYLKTLGQSNHENPLIVLDAFYEETSETGAISAGYFTDNAIVVSITYDDRGEPQITALNPEALATDWKILTENFQVQQTPLVLVARTYGHMSQFFCSVYTQLIDRQSRDTLNIRSLQSIHMVNENGWKINNIHIQNEVSGSLISDDFWPIELTKTLSMGSRENSDPSDTANYDPNKIYDESEVELTAVYPGDEAIYRALLSSFDILETKTDSSALAFEVTIGDDGLAKIYNVSELSESQKNQAEHFVGSMLIWYPAIKDKASVTTVKKFYIR